MAGIIWLASYPKSGNTWLRAFLINLMANRDAPVPLADYKTFITGEPQGHRFAKYLGGPLRSDQRAEVARLRPKVQADIAAGGRPLALVKTHNFLGPVAGTLQINMDVTAGAIYVLRNPLDVAVSFAKHNSTTVEAAIDLMGQPKAASAMRPDRAFEPTSDWSSHVASWTARPHETLCVLRYEDMLERPAESFLTVARFLKFPDDPARLDKAIRFSTFETLSALEASDGFDEKPAGAPAFFRAGRKDQWREALSEEQVRRVVARHGAQMRRFGYA